MRRMRGSVVAVVLGVLAAQAPAQDSGARGRAAPQRGARDAVEIRASLQARLDALIETTGLPGATAAVVMGDGEGGTIEALAASGAARKEPRRAMQVGDRMLAGSIGKTFAAAVALRLVEEGKLDLDARVSGLFEGDWFGRLPNAEEITIRQLMNHTSGIPEHVRMPEFFAAVVSAPEKEWTARELLAFVEGKEALFPAEEGWSYADTNYIVLGMVIERVSGRKFYELAREWLLEPLGLDETSPSDRKALPGLVSGYTGEDNPLGIAPEVARDGVYVAFNPQMEWTGGGFISTSGDLARWMRELVAGDVLEEGTRAMMVDGVDAPRLGARYGLGLIVRETGAGTAIGHSGWFPGYLSIVCYYPDVDAAVALQVNADDVIGTGDLRGFVDGVAGKVGG